MFYDLEQVEQLKKYIFEIHKNIEIMNSKYERHFTMDGHLLGSAGEVFASFYYGIKLYDASHKIHDGEKDNKRIQIKITQRNRVEVKGFPDYLIVLKIDYLNDGVKLYEVYNGPGDKTLVGKNSDSKNNGISIKKLNKINVDDKEKIIAINKIERWNEL